MLLEQPPHFTGEGSETISEDLRILRSVSPAAWQRLEHISITQTQTS